MGFCAEASLSSFGLAGGHLIEQSHQDMHCVSLRQHPSRVSNDIQTNSRGCLSDSYGFRDPGTRLLVVVARSTINS